VEVSRGKNNVERRFEVVAGLGSGGGAEEHHWSNGTTRKGGKTPKQQEKVRKNQKKGKRKKGNGEGRKKSPSFLPQNSHKKWHRASQRRWKLLSYREKEELLLSRKREADNF
jgi:hypothetical protein